MSIVLVTKYALLITNDGGLESKINLKPVSSSKWEPDLISEKTVAKLLSEGQERTSAPFMASRDAMFRVVM